MQLRLSFLPALKIDERAGAGEADDQEEEGRELQRSRPETTELLN